MDTNKMREQFEEFMRRKPKRMRGAYLRAFEAGWKTSREAVMVELPTVRSEPVTSGDALKADGEAAAYNIWVGDKLAKEECRAAIEAQGLRVNP